MTPREYFDELNKYAKAHQKGGAPSKPIKEDITFSEDLLKSYKINNLKDAFIVFAALNYLNFAAKTTKKYGFKHYIEPFINQTLDTVTTVKFYLEKDSKGDVVYGSFFDFVFSFHATGISKSLASKLKRFKRINFDGIKKQVVAQYILNKAKEMLNKGASKKVIAPSSSSTNTNIKVNKKLINLSCDYTIYSESSINKMYHISYFCTTAETAYNLIHTIAGCYFYEDLINNGNLPNYIQKFVYRTLIIDIYSIIEAIELEVGAKLLGYKRNTRGHDIKMDSECKKSFKRVVTLSKGETRAIYNELNDSRNNVHLSKYQPTMLDNDLLSKEKVSLYFKFLKDYTSFIYQVLVNK